MSSGYDMPVASELDAAVATSIQPAQDWSINVSSREGMGSGGLPHLLTVVNYVGERLSLSSVM